MTNFSNIPKSYKHICCTTCSTTTTIVMVSVSKCIVYLLYIMLSESSMQHNLSTPENKNESHRSRVTECEIEDQKELGNSFQTTEDRDEKEDGEQRDIDG